jgi:uncharacterized membrane protein
LPEFPLIGPEEHWALLAILVAVAAFGLWAEQRTGWGRRLSGVVVAIGGTFVLSNLGVIPTSAPVYDVVWSFLVPLAIPLLLFRADLARILREAGPTLGAFAIGGVGTVIGTVIAYHLIPLGPEGWKLAGIFCATYVGGSMNYVATSEALDLRSGDLLAAGVAADNLVMTLYFLVLFALPAIGWLRRRYAGRHQEDRAGAEVTSPLEEGHLGLLQLGLALAVATVLCALGYGLSDLTGLKGTGILWVTAMAVFLATVFPFRMASLAGGERVGTFLMQVFFAAIGASANIGVVLQVGPSLFLFAGLILLIHLAFLLAAGWVLRLDLAEIVIASNANMGGPTTAAAMAVACRWRGLVIPAILCGTLGYAVATFVGVAVGHWLH